jgi:transcriptional regulator with XRE-family HTH domain
VDNPFGAAQNLSRATRFLRRRREWRQQDLAERSGVSRETISRLERGDVDGLTVGFLERLASAFGATVFIELRWHGEQLDRLMDSAHAAVEEVMVQSLRAANWTSEVEVSFNWYGDRGRCDAVAWDPGTRTLLIVEAKTQLGDVQDLLGRLDVKVRLGKQIARQIGWPEPARVIPCMVIAERGGRPVALFRHTQRCLLVSRTAGEQQTAGSAPQIRTSRLAGSSSSNLCQIHTVRPRGARSESRIRQIHARCESGRWERVPRICFAELGASSSQFRAPSEPRGRLV